MSFKYEPVAQCNDLSWLCSEGPYLEFIKRLTSRNPSICKPDPKNYRIGSRVGTSRSVVLNVSPDHTVKPRHFSSITDLKTHFKQREKDDAQGKQNTSRRVYILEGLDPQFIEAYGSYFYMDPMLFVKQERNTVWNLRDIQEEFSDTASLPSLHDPQRYFRLKYREMRKFGQDFNHWHTTCATSGSHIAAIGFERKLASVAAVERKCSFWFKDAPGGHGGWDAVILCEPPLDKVFRAKSLFSQEIKSSTFQGGYMDFIDFDDLTQNGLDGNFDGPPRTCMFDDLCFYFERHSPLLFTIEGQTPPSLASAFLKKLVAAHYMKMIDYFEITVQKLKKIGWRLSQLSDWEKYNSWPEKREQWSSLQLTQRRLSEYCFDIHSIIQTLHMPSSSAHPSHYLTSDLDFPFIHHSLSTLHAVVTNLVTSTQGLSSIVANREALQEARLSVREARDSKTLTFVGLVFIPLAYTSALFSMSDEYRPGGKEFWVYWVTALPVMVLVFGVTWGMHRGWDMLGKWGRRGLKGLERGGNKEAEEMVSLGRQK